MGDDPSGRFILEWLRERKLDGGVSKTTSAPTHKAFLAYDKAGTRLMFTNAPNANRWLSVDDITPHEEVIRSSSLVLVSGYCYMDRAAPRVQAARRVVELASSKSTGLLVFDVVPHKFHEIYPNIADFLKLAERANIIVSEVNTIRRLFGLGHRGEDIGDREVKETVDRLRGSFNGSFDLRYGGGTNIERQAIWIARIGELRDRKSPMWQKSSLRGYGDWLTLMTLQEFFKPFFLQ